MNKNKKLVYLFYSLSYIGITIFTQVTVKWYQYFYAPPEMNEKGLRILIPIGFIGLTMIIGRLFDGLSDPLVAYYSDKSTHKLGRRIPFVLYGAVPLAVVFILIWFPPVNGQSIANFIYLTFMLSLFFIFFTIVVGPYLALITDLSKTKEERISVTMMQGLAQIVGVMIAEVGSGALINMFSYKIMGLLLGILSLVTILLTPLFVREEKTEDNVLQTMSLFKSVKLTLTNRDFLYYLLFYNTVWFGINTLTISMPYMTEVLLKKDPATSGLMVASAFILALISTPFIPKLVLFAGKKKVLIASALFFSILLILMGFIGTLFSFTASFIIVLLAGIPLAMFFVVPNAMIADIAELDGAKNGFRREGMFFGAQGLVVKIIMGVSSFVTPFLFNTFGYSADKPLGLQLCGPIAGIAVIVGTLIMFKYSITEEQIDELHKSINKGS